MHDIGLVLTLAAGLVAALLLGLASMRIGLSPIVGYLLAGVLVGPHTPGYVADADAARQLAEIGIILLMFGVGLHFHLRDLAAVRRIATVGAIGQMAIAWVAGAGLARLAGWSWSASLVTGASISVASTVVLVRVLADNGALHEEPGRIAVGWLIIEDILTVVILVLLPALAGGGDLVGSLGLALARLVALVAVVLGVGGQVIPALLRHVARTGSRELFTLAVLAIALALAAGSMVVFGASMALGAFLAGVVAGQSEVSEQAAADALPMKDAFGVIFFVSVGMLFDPRALGESWPVALAMLGVILIVKPLVAAALVLLHGYSIRAALTVGIALAQIGEFSFIVADTARHLGLIDVGPANVLTVAALISIALNPLYYRAIPRLERALAGRGWPGQRQRVLLDAAGRASLPALAHAIVVGHGPVGEALAGTLREAGVAPVVIELNVDTIVRLHRAGVAAIYGDATRAEILESAGVRGARVLVVTLPDPAARNAVILAARALNPELTILTRARYAAERAELAALGVDGIACEEDEVAARLQKMYQMTTSPTTSADTASQSAPAGGAADSGAPSSLRLIDSLRAISNNT